VLRRTLGEDTGLCFVAGRVCDLAVIDGGDGWNVTWYSRPLSTVWVSGMINWCCGCCGGGEEG
jgi:hypothetical protein